MWFFMRLWLRFTGNDQVSGVLRNFQRTIEKLDRTQLYNQKEVERYNSIIHSAEVGRDLADREAAKADAVATKLRGIIES